MSSIEENKRSSLDFLNLVLEGKVDEAYDKYIDMSGKHHNLFCAAGFPALKVAMKGNGDQFSEKRPMMIKNVVAEGDLVAIHFSVAPNPGMNMVAIHFHRYKDGKIVELWDCGQVIPPDPPNKDGAF